MKNYHAMLHREITIYLMKHPDKLEYFCSVFKTFNIPIIATSLVRIFLSLDYTHYIAEDKKGITVDYLTYPRIAEILDTSLPITVELWAHIIEDRQKTTQK